MSEPTPDSPMEPPAKLKRRWWQWFLMYPTLFASLIGAVPQYGNWYAAWKLGVPWGAATEAEAQDRLWRENSACSWKREFQAAAATAQTPDGTRVNVTVCPTGDILVEWRNPGSPPRYRWVGFDRFEGSASRWTPRHQAFAGDTPRDAAAMHAQSDGSVICQFRDPKGHIVRRIRLVSGGCRDEVINPYMGKVISVKPAPCTAC